MYVPIQKQGGDTNTIAVVSGIRDAIRTLRDIPTQLKTHVVFDQSVFVKEAISTVLREGGVGIFLTGLMILVFLGSLRATAAVFLSIPLSVMIAFFILHVAGRSIDSMVLSGLALAFSRLIDDSVVVLENVYRHIELGEEPKVAAIHGANEVALAVLAIMLVAVVVFFPVTLLFGVSKYLFTALALGVVLALFASYFCAVTVVPLYCAYVLNSVHEHGSGASASTSWGARFHARFNSPLSIKMLDVYEKWVQKTLDHPTRSRHRFHRGVLVELPSLSLHWRFVLSAHGCGPICNQRQSAHRNSDRAPDRKVRQRRSRRSFVRRSSPARPGHGCFQHRRYGRPIRHSALRNSAMHTAFVQVGLKADHKVSSFVYMNEVRERISAELPELRPYFQSGGLVDSVLNQGMPAPID